MATVPQAIQILEGIVGTVPNASTSYQSLQAWAEGMKAVMKSTQALRDATDWTVALSDDVDESANDLETGGTLYGFVAMPDSSSARQVVAFHDDADGSYTYDATATIGATFLCAVSPPVTGTDNTEEYFGAIYPSGLAFTNHLCVGADGLDGTNPSADDMRVIYVIRTT